MVYLDWEEQAVSVMIGAVSMQVPRYFTFHDEKRTGFRGEPGRRALYAEFCVFQREQRNSSENVNNDDSSELPNIVCSKIARAYNTDGSLKQGCTGFFDLKRSGDY
jgi:hypothetical protein